MILCYMFNGHYDAVVDSPDIDNPEYKRWNQQRGEDDFASETLARKLQVCGWAMAVTLRIPHNCLKM